MSIHIQSNRLPVRRLFVFGAGASYGASISPYKITNFAPVDKEFCKAIVEKSKTQRPQWAVKVAHNIVNGWLDKNPISDFGLEEAIIRQLGHMSYCFHINTQRKTKYKSHEDFLRDAAKIISYLLERTRENGKTEPYKKISDSLLIAKESPKNNRIEQDRVVSFNYDTLFDQHLLKNYTDQRIYFDRIGIQKGKRRPKGSRSKFPIMLKLHGSINWRMPGTDFDTIIAAGRPGSPVSIPDYLSIRRSDVSVHQDRLLPCIIPPIPGKPITEIKLFNFIWTRAAEYLSTAKEIHLCGYSLPKADTLAAALFSNINNQRLKKIVVVDPQPAVIETWLPFFKKKHHICEYVSDFQTHANSLCNDN